jgi:hypothetical protein
VTVRKAARLAKHMHKLQMQPPSILFPPIVVGAGLDPVDAFTAPVTFASVFAPSPMEPDFISEFPMTPKHVDATPLKRVRAHDEFSMTSNVSSESDSDAEDSVVSTADDNEEDECQTAVPSSSKKEKKKTMARITKDERQAVCCD